MLLQMLILQQMKLKQLSWKNLSEMTGISEDELHNFVFKRLIKSEMLKNLEKILIALDAFSFDNKEVDKKWKSGMSK